jgi:phytanoyl-CoA hydroxylase
MPHADSPPSSTTHPHPPPTYYVNDGPLDPSQIAPLLPTTLDTPLPEVRARYARDGYVFLKGLLPRADVLAARHAYFSLLAPSGVLAPGTAPVDGIFDRSKDNRDFPGIGAGGADANGVPTGPHPEVAERFVELALKAHTEGWYKDVFCQHPKLREYVAGLTGWGEENTLAVRRTLLRNNTPRNDAIGVHYDQIFLRHGEDTAVTAWVPMGDVRMEGGGLIYLEGGHRLGEEIEGEFTRKAREAGMSEEEARFAFNRNMMSGGMLMKGAAEFGRRYGKRWLLAEYEAGDVVLHNSYAIHASTVNHDPEERIRVGTDLRFVDKRRPWDTRWDKDFEFNDGV